MGVDEQAQATIDKLVAAQAKAEAPLEEVAVEEPVQVEEVAEETEEPTEPEEAES